MAEAADNNDAGKEAADAAVFLETLKKAMDLFYERALAFKQMQEKARAGRSTIDDVFKEIHSIEKEGGHVFDHTLAQRMPVYLIGKPMQFADISVRPVVALDCENPRRITLGYRYEPKGYKPFDILCPKYSWPGMAWVVEARVDLQEAYSIEKNVLVHFNEDHFLFTREVDYGPDEFEEQVGKFREDVTYIITELDMGEGHHSEIRSKPKLLSKIKMVPENTTDAVIVTAGDREYVCIIHNTTWQECRDRVRHQFEIGTFVQLRRYRDENGLHPYTNLPEVKSALKSVKLDMEDYYPHKSFYYRELDKDPANIDELREALLRLASDADSVERVMARIEKDMPKTKDEDNSDELPYRIL